MLFRKLGLAGCIGVMLVLGGCLTSTPATPVPAPPLPSEWASLPREGRMRCSGSATPEAAIINLWEAPGTKPPDPDSAPMGYRGSYLGKVHGCDIVMLTEVRWSPWDSEFYLYVKTDTKSGWVTSHLIDAGYVSTAP